MNGHPNNTTQAASCPLCNPPDNLNEIWRNAQLRVIDVPDAGYPGYTRVIWNEHVTEMTDLNIPQREHLMNAVWLVETVMRNELSPLKVNLAQFGNQVPHLHWHIIPRWPLDSHFPDAIWAVSRQRSPEQQLAWEGFREQQENLLADYHAALRTALSTL